MDLYLSDFLHNQILHEILLKRWTMNKSRPMIAHYKKELFLTVFPILAGWLFWFYSISTFVGYSYLPTPPLGQDITQGQFLNRV